jgi:3-hydroxyisobutyrate dehydrogenase
MDIGLIGLGNIGVHFGTRLLAAGHNLFVHDKSTKAKNHLAALGIMSITRFENRA